MTDRLEPFDVVVVGAGPGGYSAAIRAAQLGLRVAVVDERRNPEGRPVLGGTCLNIGCIPSKALLESSQRYHDTRFGLAHHGIRVGEIGLDLTTLQQRKSATVDRLTRGIAGLFRKHRIENLSGRACLKGRATDGFRIAIGDDEVTGRQVILAPGSIPRPLPEFIVDHQRILDSTDALSLTTVPGRLGILGAGVIGLELGSVWQRLGSQVTILEAQAQFLPSADRELAGLALASLSRDEGLSIRLAVQPLRAVVKDDGVQVILADGDETLEFDRLVVAVGRIPNTTLLGLESLGLGCDERGRIPVNPLGESAVAGLWAIGDAVAGPMLAHKAAEEGVAVAERIAGQKTPPLDFHSVPWVVYTHPELAWVGSTEAELERQGRAYRVGRFPFAASGRAQALGDTRGLVKILSCPSSDRILGVHLWGPQASELISEAVVALEFGATSEDLARIIHAHPTLSEALHEAALGVANRSINF